MTTQIQTSPFDTGHYERCIDKLDEFFWVYDLNNYCFIYVGAGYARIWEKSRKPLYESAGPFFESIHPNDRSRIHEAFCDDSAASYNERYKVVRPDGSVRWIRDRAFPLLDGQQRIGHIAGLATDLTDIIRRDSDTERETHPPDMRPTIKLDRTQKKYQRLFHESADAAVLFDIHGYVVEANARAAELLGFGIHEMIRMHFSSFCPSETLAAAMGHWDQVTNGHSARFNLPLLRSDGTRVTTESAAALIEFGPEYVVQMTFRNVTPRVQIAEELEAARDQLAQAQKMELVGQLAGGVAHDFNNLLSVIMMCTQLIDGSVASDSALRDDTQRILQASESAASLVRRMLTFARQEVAKPELVDPKELLERVRPLLERSLPKNITVTMDLSSSINPILLAPIELEQIMMNLGINARDAMPDGGELSITLSSIDANVPTDDLPAELDCGRFVCIRISDTGVGMDEGTKERIYDPFFTTKSKSKGTGLGLSTVLNLIEENNGHICVDSSPGAGTTFELYFPEAEADAPIGMGLAEISDSSKTLLVVDDDPQVRQLVRRILDPAGYTTLVAANAEQALELLEESDGEVDLLVTDIVMPQVDGPTLVGRARQRWPHIRVLYTSGYVKDAKTRRSLRADDVSFIAKPLTPDKLLSKLHQVLAKR